MIKLFKKYRRSLFLKILFTFFIAIALFFTTGFLMHRTVFRRNRFPKIQRNAVNLSLYIMHEIGSPPDTVRARQIADSKQISMRFEGSEFNWSSHPDMPRVSDLDLPVYPTNPDISAGFDAPGICVTIRDADGHYLFITESRGEGFSQAAEHYSLVLIFSITVILGGVYFVIRWLLGPIRELHHGVRQLTSGNLDYQTQTRRKDELGELIRSFNLMAKRIREMIHAREHLLLDVSHELRSPLTRTKVTLEMMDDSPDKQDLSDDIHEMETMISEILESARLKSEYGGLNLQEIDIIALLRNVSEEFSKLQPGIKVVTSPEQVALQLDPERIKILLKNIFANAIKYSDSNSYPVEVSVREKTDEVIIEVQDFGSGIPEKELPYIFEPFYRVDKSRSKETGGYGLGMSMSKKIMEAHGGIIEISSKLEIGTTVFLKFRKG